MAKYDARTKATAIVLARRFQMFADRLISEMKAAGIEDLMGLIAHAPPSHMLECLCFIKACDGRRIRTRADVEALPFAELILLAADYYRIYGAALQERDERGSK